MYIYIYTYMHTYIYQWGQVQLSDCKSGKHTHSYAEYCRANVHVLHSAGHPN